MVPFDTVESSYKYPHPFDQALPREGGGGVHNNLSNEQS